MNVLRKNILRQNKGTDIRSVSASFFLLKQLRLTFSLGLNLVGETGGKSFMQLEILY